MGGMFGSGHDDAIDLYGDGAVFETKVRYKFGDGKVTRYVARFSVDDQFHRIHPLWRETALGGRDPETIVAIIMFAMEPEMLAPPAALPNDDEDVAWCLSTAEAMWKRDDHEEGLRWLQRAIDSAQATGSKDRATELEDAHRQLMNATATVTPAGDRPTMTIDAALAETLARSSLTAPPPPNVNFADEEFEQHTPAGNVIYEARAKAASVDPPAEPNVVQAVRVIVWKDASGVHVAPPGTMVSAITADAILLAVDSDTNLRAWLRKG